MKIRTGWIWGRSKPLGSDMGQKLKKKQKLSGNTDNEKSIPINPMAIPTLGQHCRTGLDTKWIYAGLAQPISCLKNLLMMSLLLVWWRWAWGSMSTMRGVWRRQDCSRCWQCCWMILCCPMSPRIQPWQMSILSSALSWAAPCAFLS